MLSAFSEQEYQGKYDYLQMTLNGENIMYFLVQVQLSEIRHPPKCLDSRRYWIFQQLVKLCKTSLNAGQFAYLKCSTTISDKYHNHLDQPLS